MSLISFVFSVLLKVFEDCRDKVLHLSVMQLYSFAASMIYIHSTTAISFKRCTNSNVCGENNVRVKIS